MSNTKPFNPLQAGDRLNAFVIIDRGEGQKPFWTKIGAAWVNKDGSLNVRLDALPVTGELHLRLPSPDEDSTT